MPCLRLFGRRWGIADDDVIFAATPWFFHVVWIILLPILIQVCRQLINTCALCSDPRRAGSAAIISILCCWLCASRGHGPS